MPGPIEQNGPASDGNAPLRWGEVLRMEVNAKLERLSDKLEHLDAVTVKHKDLMLWGAGFAVTIIGACVALWLLLSGGQDKTNARFEAAMIELQKDVRANYWATPERRPQRRLEQPPTVPQVLNGASP